jgi:hypothetical protein
MIRLSFRIRSVNRLPSRLTANNPECLGIGAARTELCRRRQCSPAVARTRRQRILRRLHGNGSDASAPRGNSRIAKMNWKRRRKLLAPKKSASMAEAVIVVGRISIGRIHCRIERKRMGNATPRVAAELIHSIELPIAIVDLAHRGRQCRPLFCVRNEVEQGPSNRECFSNNNSFPRQQNRSRPSESPIGVSVLPEWVIDIGPRIGAESTLL